MTGSPIKPVGRVVSVGELLLRLSPPPAERLFQSPQLRWYFGGSEANVAASLAHFGVDAEYVTALPKNAVGDAALAALRAEGIGTHHVVRAGSRLGIYFVESGTDLRQMRVVYDRAGSAFSELQPDAIRWNDVLRGAGRLHISGITPALSSTAAQCSRDAISAARMEGIPVSIDLNFRPAVWGARDPRPVIQPLAAGCDLLIGNRAAISAMLGIGTSENESVRSIVESVRKEFGCGIVALTQREVMSASEHGWSAALYDFPRDRIHSSKHYQIRLVDRVGGGDAFAAGLIYALLAGHDPEYAVNFAAAAGALKLTIPGDFNRVSVEEVESAMESSVPRSSPIT